MNWKCLIGLHNWSGWKLTTYYRKYSRRKVPDGMVKYKTCITCGKKVYK